MVGWREKADHISLCEVGRVCEGYAMLLGYGARRGVNNTLKWDRPCRCLVTNILGRKTRQTRPAFQKEIGAGLMSAAQVSDFPKIRYRDRGKQNKAHQGHQTSLFFHLGRLESRPTQVVNKQTLKEQNSLGRGLQSRLHSIITPHSRCRHE